MSWLSPHEQYNLLRYPERRPAEEIYCVRMTDARLKMSWWMQYILTRPEEDFSFATLQIGLFDQRGKRRPRLWQHQCYRSEIQWEPDIFFLSIAGAQCYHQGTHGQITVEGTPVSWDFRWNPGPQAYPLRPIRKWRTDGTWRDSWITPNPKRPTQGFIQWGEERFVFEQAQVTQSHGWMKEPWQTALRIQTHDIAGPEDFFGEILLSPFKRWKKHYLQFNARLHCPTMRRKNFCFKKKTAGSFNINIPTWEFKLKHHPWKLQGTLTCSDYFAFPLPNSNRILYHSESATLDLTLFDRGRRQWTPQQYFQANSCVSVDWLTNIPFPAAPIILGQQLE